MRAVIRSISLLVILALLGVPAWANSPTDVQAQGKKGGGGGGGGGGATSPMKDASLSSLTVSAGTLSPAFASATLAYTVGPAVLPATVKVTASTTQAGATFTVNGVTGTSGSPSQDLALGIGVTRVTLRVTAPDGRTRRSYTIDFDRTSVRLAAVSVSAGSVSPTFSADTLAYGVGPVSTASTTVTATAEDPGATVLVNGVTVTSGAASGAIALSVGVTAISVQVVGRDGSSQTTTVSVDRTSSLLAGLSVGAGALSPAFNAAIQSYGVGPVLAASTTVTPTAVDAGATLKVNGTVVASGTASDAIALGMGFTSVTVEVVARDGTSATTTVIVDRTSAGITSVTASATPLTYNAATSTYSAGPALVPATTTVTVTAEDPNATVTVDGVTASSGVPSSSVALAPGVSTHTVVVTARDGGTTTTRYIQIDRALGDTQQALASLGGWTRITMHGDTMAVGSFQENPYQRGKVRVFRRNAATRAWEFEADLFPTPDMDYHDMQFGGAVSLWGDTLAIGAQLYPQSGAVFIYRRGPGGWAFEQRLEYTKGDGLCGRFGNSVALYEDTLVVGSQVYNMNGKNIGGVFVFARAGATWAEVDALHYRMSTESILPMGYGWFLAVHGETIAFSSFNTENVYVYTRSSGGWTLQQVLVDTGGQGLCLCGDTMIAGTKIYEREGSTWVFKQSLAGQGGVTSSYYAYRATSADTLVLAAPNAAIVWLRTATGWQKKHSIAAPAGASSTFGWDVAVSGEDIGVVTKSADGDGAYRVYLFR